MSIVYKSQVRLRSLVSSGRNDVVSTLHFVNEFDDDPADCAESAAFQHIDFINQDHGTADSIAAWIPALMSRAVDETTIDVYSLADEIPRSPVYSNVFQLNPVLGAGYPSLPRQLAVALSYRGNLAGVSEGQPGVEGQPRPRSRRRGRMFIGPLITAAQYGPGEVEVRPAEPLIQSLGEAALTLMAGTFDSQGNTKWCVWSPTADEAYEVVSASVDNRFDVQRRRASEATVRTAFP